MSSQIKIFTFGSFQVTGGDLASIDATTKQSKIWNALRYLIAFYGNPVPAEKLASVIWPDGDNEEPTKMLRQIVYRLRKTLAAYGEDKPYILYRNGHYLFNKGVDCWIDFLEFSRLLSQARDDSKPFNERVALYNASINL